MQKKMFIFLGAIVVLFAALYFVIDYKNKQAVNDSENPYGDKKLQQATIDQLGDPLYGNQIMPEELEEKIKSGETATIYFYAADCHYCQQTTPVLVPLTEELDIDMQKLNLLEFRSEWNKWGIESTPTLVHYENGKEVARIVGQRSEDEFRAFFDEFVLK